MNLEFETTEEMEDIFREGYYDFSKRIIDVTLENLDATEEVHILEILAKDTGTLYEITLEPEDKIEVLKQNLKIIERFEDYETCSKVIEAIRYLEQT